jgi:hypothetical protein
MNLLLKLRSMRTRITPNHPDFDILYAIQSIIRDCPITWRLVHVKGHQDGFSAVQDLSCLARLNCETDRTAKQKLARIHTCPPAMSIKGEPWTIWQDSPKK